MLAQCACAHCVPFFALAVSSLAGLAMFSPCLCSITLACFIVLLLVDLAPIAVQDMASTWPYCCIVMCLVVGRFIRHFHGQLLHISGYCACIVFGVQ